MIVEQIWTGNSLRNYNYLIACPETGEALAIDPLDARQCLTVAKQHGWTITQILNTHEHPDHIGGNKALATATGATISAHQDAGKRIANMDRGLAAGDVVRVGKTVELECLDTPGHTMSHICLLSHSDQPALFSGDTLFNAGAGNCHNGGDPATLFNTFEKQLNALSDDTLVYPGHDYLHNNLSFTLDREPDNAAAQELLRRSKEEGTEPTYIVTTLKEEKEFNVFLRLQNESIIEGLRAAKPDSGKAPSPEDVFLALRELRNHW